MSDGIDFDQHLAAYLAIRDALGLAAGARPRLLRSFLDHACMATEPEAPIRAATALTWACDHAPPGCGDAGKAYRLTVARGFLAYLSGIVPGTEVPSHNLLADQRRRRPYILSDADIEVLAAAAAKAPRRGSLRPVMPPRAARLAGQHGPADRRGGPSEGGRRPAGGMAGAPARSADQISEVRAAGIRRGS